jgi:hypothetical protein
MITIIVTDGAVDPNAPPPYELSDLPIDDSEPDGPWQYTLNVAHIPEAIRAKARQGSLQFSPPPQARASF